VRILLVTGGAGFLGANFVQHWVSRHPGDRVVVLDALTYAGCRDTLAPLESAGRIMFVHGDILSAPLVQALFATHGVDHVVHFAAESHVDRSIAGPEAFVRTNVLGTHVLLEAARAAWCTSGLWRAGVRFHHISTDEVFGALDPHAAPVTEAAPYRPSSPYSASKAAADHLVRAYGHTYGLPYTISHCANNYGPYQFPEKLIPHMIVRALHGRPLPVYGDGRQRREWLHVHDHCVHLEALLLANVTSASFNIGGQAEVENIDVVRQLCAQLDAAFAADATLATRFPDCPAAHGASCVTLITHVTDRPGHDRRYALDAGALRALVGALPLRTVRDGLADTVRWYLQHESWWRDKVPSLS
jgi:dTDP-glucose 4,6-dehydratase